MTSPASVRARQLWYVLAPALGIVSMVRPVPPPAGAASNPYLSFESPQIHPLALTPDGTRLLALNTPDNRLAVFALSGASPRLEREIPVGLEPVSVAARSDHQAWVANWLSDSVSVVDLDTGNVIRTLEVGDEPTDVLFAGGARVRAYVCVAGRSEVKVYDPDDPAATPIVLGIRGKQPRSLARDPSGARVFVSVFESGNGTTVLSADQVKKGGGPPSPVPKLGAGLPTPPDAGLIVGWNGSAWADETGDTRWDAAVPYRLADVDLVVIDGAAATPAIRSEIRSIGTHVGNAVCDPATGRIWVVNTESRNLVRFEPNLRGRFVRTRISEVDPDSGAVVARDLNPHVPTDGRRFSGFDRALSLALPADLARASDGTLYVAAMGSDRIGVLSPSGAVEGRVAVGGGPTGLALDEPRGRLYVLDRFEGELSVVDTALRAEVARVRLGYDPEPASLRAGRRLLYDARLSAYGDAACASCHRNGNRDGLAWDLGDPTGELVRVGGGLLRSIFHPMKGPMTTQSLRGTSGTEPLHWRGDRAKLEDFNPAFESLLGAPRRLSPDEMASFAAFVETLAYPPNPNQNLDRTLPDPATGPSAARGERLFKTARLDGGIVTCNACHAADGFAPGTTGLIIPAVLLDEPQDFKVPQLRGMYEKTGMRNTAGEGIAGFGFIHDGSVATLFDFLKFPVFTFKNDDERRDVEAYVLAFDSGLAPAVGLQVTFGGDNRASEAARRRLELLMAQARAGNCDLVAKGRRDGAARGYLFASDGTFQPDRRAEAPLGWEALVDGAATGAELTFTGVPPGAGRRAGIDRDLDGTLDGDEPR